MSNVIDKLIEAAKWFWSRARRYSAAFSLITLGALVLPGLQEQIIFAIEQFTGKCKGSEPAPIDYPWIPWMLGSIMILAGTTLVVCKFIGLIPDQDKVELDPVAVMEVAENEGFAAICSDYADLHGVVLNIVGFSPEERTTPLAACTLMGDMTALLELRSQIKNSDFPDLSLDSRHTTSDGMNVIWTISPKGAD